MRNKNKKLGFIPALLALLIATALGVAACAAIFWSDRTEWPIFPSEVRTQAGLKAAAAPDPEIVAHLERDFGWRIGDVIPVTVYLKQKPGTLVDLNSIALAGDFEMVGAPDFFELSRPDGAKVYRVKIKLQSFTAAPQWSLKANISYRLLATNDDITVDLPTIAPYTSKTWDGRDKAQEGKLVILHGWHDWMTLLYLVVGAVGTVVFFRYSRYFYNMMPMKTRLRKRLSRFIKARRQFDAIWAKMEAGDRSRENYVALSRVIRKLYLLETKTSLEAKFWFLYGRNGPAEIADMLIECDKVIYLNAVLSDEEHYRIKTIFDSLVKPIPAPETAQVDG
jgi:hypothetical protein